MGYIAWIVLGGVAGWIASMVMKTDASQGIMLNIIVGIAGSTLGGWLLSLFGGVGVTGFNLYSLGVSVIGAMILIGILRMI